MTVETIIQDIHNNKVEPLYVLHGDEPFFMDQLVHVLENDVLDEAAKGFDFQVLYGKDVSAQQLVDGLRAFPFMSPKQMVILKEAQAFQKLEALIPYFEQPSPTTIFVVVHSNKSIDKRSSFYKIAQKSAVCFESTKVKDYKLQEWIRSYIRAKNLTVTDAAVALIDDHIGNDLKRITKAIDQILVNSDNTHIDEDLVEKYVGISKEFNGFELANAILKRDLPKALRIIHYFEQSKSSGLIPQIALLYGTFTKLSLIQANSSKSDSELAKLSGVMPFLIREYKGSLSHYDAKRIENGFFTLYQYDLKSKGILAGIGNEYDLMKEMLFKLLA